MAPKRKNDDLTAEQKVELHKKRNRDKQAALRARRAARLKELEEENAKLAAASALAPETAPTSSSSSNGTAPGPFGSAAYEGAIGRLVCKLRALGVDEREIQALLAGNDGGQAQPPRPPPAPVQRAPQRQISSASALPGYPTLNLLPPAVAQCSSASACASTTLAASTTASAGGSLWTAGIFDNVALPPTGVCDSASHSTGMTPPGTSSPSSGSATSDMPFPFSFLFADAGISHPPADPTIPAFGHPLTLDSLQPTPSSPATSSASAVTLPLTAGSAGPSSTSPPEPAFAATSDDAHLSALERGIQALFDKLKHGPRAIGGREGLFKGSKEAQAEAVKDMAATQLLILQLLGATSTQKEAYDTQCTISAQELFLLETEDLDPRVHFIPNPAFRIRLGLAARDHGLDLTKMVQSMIEEVQIFGDVWDWTGWKMPDDFMLQLPVDTKTDSLFFPTAANNWAPKTPALRPRPAYLRGSSVRDIILGREAAGAREAGPFATTCTVQLVDQEILSFTQA